MTRKRKLFDELMKGIGAMQQREGKITLSVKASRMHGWTRRSLAAGDGLECRKGCHPSIDSVLNFAFKNTHTKLTRY
jgi:hypothetical protein